MYNFLDDNINFDKYSLVDINRIWKDIDSRLSTDGGISDMAVLSTDFIFKNENIGKVYGFVEVKAVGVSLRETQQVLGQMEKTSHFIYTNGIVWKYYCNQKLEWEKNLCTDKIPYSLQEITIDEGEFEQLRKEIKKIPWKSENFD